MAFLILSNADFKPSRIGPTIDPIAGITSLYKNFHHKTRIGKRSSRTVFTIWPNAGPNDSPKFFAKSVSAGMPLLTMLLTNGVMASNTYDPTVSLASSNATLSRAILPSNVSACFDA